MPNTKLSTPVAAIAQNNPGGEPRLISAVATDSAAPQFKIPFSSQAIQSVESVDLDLVLTTTTGEKIILQQGALQAATQPDSKIVFQNGDSITAADQIKKLGILKPVEGGSFRLKSGDASPAVAEKVTGDAFGLGKELQDTMSQLTETSKQLEKVLQTLTTASLSTTTDDAKPITAGPGTGTGVQKITPQSDKFASPSPGSPPKPEVEEFTSNNTNNNTSNNTATATATSTNASNIKVTNTLRGLYAEKGDVITNVQVVDKIKTAALTPGEREQGIEVLKDFSQASLREMLPEDPLQVRIRGADPVNLEPSGLALNTLVMPGVLNATSVRFELPAGSELPTGFKLNGKAFEDGVVVVSAESLVDLKLPIEWAVISQDQTVTAFDFQLGVKYLDAKGSELEQGRAPLTFTYGELKNLADTVQLDGNSNTKIFLSAHGYNFNIRGDAQDNTITSGHGRDTLAGGAGNDTLISGAGNDRLDGGTGVDSMSGGAGDDIYVVDDRGDVVNELAGQGTDLVESTATFTLSDNVENLTLKGNAAIDATGNGLANILTGNNADNRLDGGAGVDSMSGGLGNDTYVVDDSGDRVNEEAGQGTDLVESTATFVLNDNVENLTLKGDATINGTGNDLDNILSGNDSDNILSGGNGKDTLIGGLGMDHLDGGAGADNMQGGGGNDTYVVDNTLDLVTEGDNAGTDTVESAITYILGNHLENLTLTGVGAIDGTGNGSANTIVGNRGNNRIDGGAGADNMQGGVGDDTYVVDNTGDLVTEGENAGIDTVESTIAYVLGNHLENLTLTGTDAINGAGNGSANTIMGNSGDNTLIGGAGNDTLIGGQGNDTVSFSNITSTTVSIVASLGFNNADGSATGDGSDVLRSIENITGGAGADTLTGNEQANTLNGDGGADTLIGGAGNDTLIGGDGNDTASFSNVTTVSIVASLGIGTADGSATGDGSDVLRSIENLIGGAGADTLTGNEQTNTLNGGGGNDTLIGGAGNDTLIGGDGIDTAVFSNIIDTTVSIVASLGMGTADGSVSGDGTDVLRSIENLIGGAGADNLTGNEQANTLNGGGGADTLIGGAGADTLAGDEGKDVLNGEDGNDLIFGGAGADAIDGGAGIDTASYSGSGDAVTVNLASGSGTGGHAEGDMLTTIENLMGSAHGDTLTGNSGVNRLEGGGGNDTLDGGGGSDTLLGGMGDDTYFINNAGITITENLSEGTDAVSSSINDYTLGAHLENLTLIGSAIIGAGNTLNNTLTANNLGNTLSGGDGNDTLIGGAGNDTLNGDVGNDTLRAIAGNNTLNGGAGNDSLFAGTGNDYLNGGAGNDMLDLRTSNSGLVDDRADGGAGDDTFIINQSQNTGITTILDGGSGSDTLRVIAGATLDLSSLNAKNFEKLDLNGDGLSTKVSLSASDVLALVENGSKVLTLRLDKAESKNPDSYVIEQESGVNVTQGQSIFFHNSANILIAQVNFEYA